jgi:anti-sigma28 factor (negative regulator of flagellin synthesis)
MSVKTKSIGALFVALVIILAVNPKVVNNIYSSILGRLFLVCVVIFFAMNNTTLGLLVALAIITASNQFGSFVEATLPTVEGMDNLETTTSTTIGQDSDTNGIKPVLTDGAVKKRISEIKDDIANGTNPVDTIGMDRSAKLSNQLPSPPSNSTENVTPSSEGMLNSSATLEGFTTYSPF